MAPVDATAKGAPSPSSPADAAPAEKQPDLQQKKWQPLPEGKLFHEEEPEPEPLKIEPPKMDATDIESGSATLSTWSLLPVQAAVGWMTAVAMLPVTFCTCGLGGCLTPAVTTFAQVSFGDYSSDQRGSLFGPLLATHCVYGGCVGTPIALWAAAVAALAVGMPVVIPVYVALSVVALWAPFVTAIPILLGATVLVATAGALSYALVSEPKEEGDADVRFPGFFSPAHKSTLPASGDDDPSPTPPETAMAY